MSNHSQIHAPKITYCSFNIKFSTKKPKFDCRLATHQLTLSQDEKSVYVLCCHLLNIEYGHSSHYELQMDRFQILDCLCTCISIMGTCYCEFRDFSSLDLLPQLALTVTLGFRNTLLKEQVLCINWIRT